MYSFEILDEKSCAQNKVDKIEDFQNKAEASVVGKIISKAILILQDTTVRLRARGTLHERDNIGCSCLSVLLPDDRKEVTI